MFGLKMGADIILLKRIRTLIRYAMALGWTDRDPTAGVKAYTADRIIAVVNDLVVRVSSVALIAAGLVLTYSVIVRYFLKISTDWQDEMSVFLIICPNVGVLIDAAERLFASRSPITWSVRCLHRPPSVDRFHLSPGQSGNPTGRPSLQSAANS